MCRYHITNSYGFIKNKILASRQKRFAEIAREMDFVEMGIYNYTVSSDSEADLNARLQGVTASAIAGDIVIVQLPSGNGAIYEEKLMRMLNDKEAKVILLWHSMNYYIEYKNRLAIWADFDYEPAQVCQAFMSSKWQIKHLFINGISEIHKQYELDAKSYDWIHVGFGIHDKNGNYCQWLGVAMQSIIEHTNSRVHFHIVHDDTMTDLNRHRLIYICSRNGHRISFHNIEANLFGDLEDRMKGYTIGALFRIMLPEICTELSKIIYLDADLLINCDIKELWDINISEYCLAAVPDENVVKGYIRTNPTAHNQVDKEQYFNSGVLYLNLDSIRSKGNIFDEICNYLKDNPDSNLPDQDALNVIYRRNKLLLDSKWNRHVRDIHGQDNLTLEACIYHYVGHLPACYSGGAIDYLYMDTVRRTPWGIEAYTFLLRRSLQRQLTQINNLEMLSSVLAMHNKKLIFYGVENSSMQALYEILSVDQYESYRIGNALDNHGKLQCIPFDFIKNLDIGSYVVFVLAQADGGKGLQNLNELGLTVNKDYFIIQNIMDVEKGGWLV